MGRNNFHTLYEYKALIRHQLHAYKNNLWEKTSNSFNKKRNIIEAALCSIWKFDAKNYDFVKSDYEKFTGLIFIKFEM